MFFVQVAVMQGLVLFRSATRKTMDSDEKGEVVWYYKPVTGSTPYTLHLGLYSLAADETPAKKPPPPQQATTMSVFGWSSNISSPQL